jgi:hypothetical protein
MDTDAADAWAVNTLLLMRSWYIPCHALADGSMPDMSAIKIFASCIILANAMCDA